jgi:D-glycero-alpha-D-manno-heptose-7-phosphate kinase
VRLLTAPSLVVTRTPLRVSLFGGGTDLPEYYRDHGGAVLSLGIDKYLDVVVRARWDGEIAVAHTDQRCVDVDSVQDALTREALRITGTPGGVDITALSDVPAQGSGLGSSSAYAVGLVHALVRLAGRTPDPGELAELACEIEIDRLGEPIGKQDQYAAAFGGCNEYRFHPDDRVSVLGVPVSPEGVRRLERHCLMFFTGRARRAGSVLTDQRARIPQTLDHLHALRDLVPVGRRLLCDGDLPGLGGLLHAAWQRKKQLSPRIGDAQIDAWYARARAAGAWGGKLLGAGGGGYLFFLAPPRSHLDIGAALSVLAPMPVSFTSTGTAVLDSGGWAIPR